jgi:hypothetical protein
MREAIELLSQWYDSENEVAGPLPPTKETKDFLQRVLWTREPPTKPGWYWAYDQINDPVLVRVDEKSVVWTLDWDRGLPVFSYNLWAGPIEAPSLPETV